MLVPHGLKHVTDRDRLKQIVEFVMDSLLSLNFVSEWSFVAQFDDFGALWIA